MGQSRVTNPTKVRKFRALIGCDVLWARTNGGRGRSIHVVGSDGREWEFHRHGLEYVGAATGRVWTPNADGSWTLHETRELETA